VSGEIERLVSGGRDDVDVGAQAIGIANRVSGAAELWRFGNVIGAFRVPRLEVRCCKWSEATFDAMLDDLSRVGGVLPFLATSSAGLAHERTPDERDDVLPHALHLPLALPLHADPPASSPRRPRTRRRRRRAGTGSSRTRGSAHHDQRRVLPYSPVMSDVITPDLVRHLEQNPGMYASAVDVGARPEIARVVYAAVEPGANIVRLVVAADTSVAFRACLAAGSRVALVAASVHNYVTFQFKGRVVDVGDATPDDIVGVEAYQTAFAALVARVGIDSRRYVVSCFTPPYTTVRVDVDAVFDQTPRMGAGEPVQRSTRASE